MKLLNRKVSLLLGLLLLIMISTFLAFKSHDETVVPDYMSLVSYDEKEEIFYNVSKEEQRKMNDFDKTKVQKSKSH
jgi:hypothetical protein